MYSREEALKKLKKYGQEHVLDFYGDIDEDKRKALLAQIEETDFSVLEHTYCESDKKEGVIEPIKALQIKEIEEKKAYFLQKGSEAIKEGKLGAVLLAGGMGTRLGFDEPKGMFDIGITRHVYIFMRLIENLMSVTDECGKFIHLFVMTSEKNHDDTTAFFKEHDNFGYPSEYIHFFKQEMVPATDYEGKVYMESPYRIATSPNGNGGWFSSLNSAGLIDLMDEKDIEWLNVFAVDNVLQKIADPVFLGAVLDGGYVSGSKVVKKASPDEKVGVMCLKDSHPSIVEYYELTEELMDTKDSFGDPAYNFGVILNYLFSVRELKRIMNEKMPLHIVEKKIPHIDEKGEYIDPKEPNGHKYEKLVLDMVEMMTDCLPFEVERDKEFAPIKNRTGKDSVDTARALLEKNGYKL
ncbi:MAG: UTP--glucose-1-phosphate uridylyltransferase [Lachnospiraceae bacterium]|nr:UTP--glucose-1-phosphate uridylyltransferase [Lachnospiraceae bacterium]